jgi:DNA repair exonuclease SbcCD ATPase subunit
MVAFRSFKEESTIDFPESGLLLIRGKNYTNQDPSGTGKSSILLAIAYALDICQFSATELQNWDSDKEMQVELTLETVNGPVVISRGKKNNIKTLSKVITSAKAISEELKSIFGLDSSTLQAITYRPQNTSGLFLSLSDTEKKEFLTRLLGLEAIEKTIESSDLSIKVLKPQIESKKQAIEPIKQSIQVLKSQSFQQFESDLEIKENLEKAEIKLNDVWERELKLQQQINFKTTEVESHPEIQKLKMYLSASKSKLEALALSQKEKELSHRLNQESLRKKLLDIAQRDTMLANYNKEIEACEAQIAKLTAGYCPTCNRVWNETKAKVESVQAQIENLKATIASLSKLQSDKKKLESELKIAFQFDPLVEKFKELIVTIQNQIKEQKTKLLTAQTTGFEQERRDIKSQLELFKSQVELLRQQLATVSSVNQRLATYKAQNEQSLSFAENKLQEYVFVIEELERKLNLELDLCLLLGREGFLGVIFEDVLREIEIEANQRLARLANVSHVTLSFRTESLNSKGGIKRSITPIASVNGHETKLHSGLSGGMFSSVDGQVDLALMTVVQRRTGFLPGFLFLDESFNGQGNITKEATMEVLKEFAQDKLVIVIDHNSEFKEMFSQYIDVSYRDGVSFLEKN